MKKIVFVCTGNTCRSPMAEGIMKKIINENNIKDIQVSSAGIFASSGDGASLEAIEVCEENGIDISNHKATLLTPKICDESDLIIPMTKEHEMIIVNAGISQSKMYSHTDISDPYGNGISIYRKTFNEIEKLCKMIAESIS